MEVEHVEIRGTGNKVVVFDDHLLKILPVYRVSAHYVRLTRFITACRELARGIQTTRAVAKQHQNDIGSNVALMFDQPRRNMIYIELMFDQRRRQSSNISAELVRFLKFALICMTSILLVKLKYHHLL